MSIGKSVALTGNVNSIKKRPRRWLRRHREAFLLSLVASHQSQSARSGKAWKHRRNLEAPRNATVHPGNHHPDPWSLLTSLIADLRLTLVPQPQTLRRREPDRRETVGQARHDCPGKGFALNRERNTRELPNLDLATDGSCQLWK